ncbi:uncharacterized protein LOC109256721 [Panthera pardus]|uniref:Uncharacterized protein LOC109256721 n=1 Tax=Panthera pardus TaxID=9691 RepID=A0A9V1ET60_PANPR|nr:uncharacterized protein LOC109256721 [Panthera pardus]
MSELAPGLFPSKRVLCPQTSSHRPLRGSVRDGVRAVGAPSEQLPGSAGEGTAGVCCPEDAALHGTQVLAAHGPCELAAGDRWPPCGTRSPVAGSGVRALPLGPRRTPAGLVMAGEHSTQGTCTPERGLDLGAVALREGTPRQENVRRGHLGPGPVGVVGTSSDSASLYLGCARSTVPGTRACQPPGCQRWARTAAVDLDPRAVEDVVSNKPGIPLITRLSERSVRVQNRYRRICTVRPRGRRHRHAVGESFEVDTGLLRMEQILRAHETPTPRGGLDPAIQSEWRGGHGRGPWAGGECPRWPPRRKSPPRRDARLRVPTVQRNLHLFRDSTA